MRGVQKNDENFYVTDSLGDNSAFKLYRFFTESICDLAYGWDMFIDCNHNYDCFPQSITN